MKYMSRHGKLADGKTRVTIVMDKALQDELKLLAKNEGRSLSNFLHEQAKAVARKRPNAEAGGPPAIPAHNAEPSSIPVGKMSLVAVPAHIGQLISEESARRAARKIARK